MSGSLEDLLEERLLAAIEFGRASYGLDDVRARQASPTPAAGSVSPVPDIPELSAGSPGIPELAVMSPQVPQLSDCDDHASEASSGFDSELAVDRELPEPSLESHAGSDASGGVQAVINSPFGEVLRPDGPEYAPRQDSSIGRGERSVTKCVGLGDMFERGDGFELDPDLEGSDFDEGLIVSDEESWDGSTMMC